MYVKGFYKLDCLSFADPIKLLCHAESVSDSGCMRIYTFRNSPFASQKQFQPTCISTFKDSAPL